MGPADEKSRTDEELVAAARDGNVRALDDLLRRHEARVLRVLRLLGVPAAEREDVAQDVFVRVFRHLGGYRAGRSFGAWIYRIAVNVTHDHRRRATRLRKEEARWDPAFDEAPDGSPGPAERLETADRQRRLEDALTCLSERERAVFVLCEMEGLTTRAVAKALGITSITVRRHLGRAREHLLRVLSDGPTKKIGSD